jgi:DNA-binding response OmpR family regulator
MAKIMVVENDPHMRRIYTEELEREGHEIIAVSSGRTALRRLDEIPVDLVLLDLMLADGNGLNCLEEILAHHRDLKIVINTAYPMFKQDFRCWGAERFLIKSSDLSELKAAINDVLGNPSGSVGNEDFAPSRPKTLLNETRSDAFDNGVLCPSPRTTESRIRINI